MRPDCGEFPVRGRIAVSRESSFRDAAKAGILFQEGALFDSFTIRENVAYPLLNQRRRTEKGASRPEDVSGEFVKHCDLWNWKRRSTSFRVSCPEACGAVSASPALQ